MKRTALIRRTPLARSGPLERTPIKAKREGPARRRNRTGEPHGMAWTVVREILWQRSSGRCELCGKPVRFDAMEAHHRLTRRLGPDCPCNAIALCGACHHGSLVHGGPALARALGTIISRHDRRPPVDVPVELWLQGPAVLRCDGSVGGGGSGGE